MYYNATDSLYFQVTLSDNDEYLPPWMELLIKVS